MYEDLRSIPSEWRPKFIPVFPRGWAYLRAWRTSRWFLALLVPVSGSAAAAVVRGRLWLEAGILAVLGLVVASVLFVTAVSGMSSSNTGTYFRDREPARFWGHVAILGAAYLGVAIAGYFL